MPFVAIKTVDGTRVRLNTLHIAAIVEMGSGVRDFVLAVGDGLTYRAMADIVERAKLSKRKTQILSAVLNGNSSGMRSHEIAESASMSQSGQFMDEVAALRRSGCLAYSHESGFTITKKGRDSLQDR